MYEHQNNFLSAVVALIIAACNNDGKGTGSNGDSSTAKMATITSTGWPALCTPKSPGKKM